MQVFERGQRVMSVDETQRLILKHLKAWQPVNASRLKFEVQHSADNSTIHGYTYEMALRCLEHDGLVALADDPSEPGSEKMVSRASLFWFHVLKLKLRNAKEFVEGVWHFLLS